MRRIDILIEIQHWQIRIEPMVAYLDQGNEMPFEDLDALESMARLVEQLANTWNMRRQLRLLEGKRRVGKPIFPDDIATALRARELAVKSLESLKGGNG